MRKYIVITTINEPSDAVVAYSKMNDHQLIVIGDNKTPKRWTCKNVEYVSVSKQKKLDFELINILPYNHYSRKMIGYLIAIKAGAQFIIDTDDDNIPKEKWTFPEFTSSYEFLPNNMGFINIYQLFTKKKIWPRGLPLNYINDQCDLENVIRNRICKVGIWQGLADEDPDVDAIYRLTNDSLTFFDEREPVVLGEGTISPFNTQNTIIRKELFPLLYLPTYVSFRFTDIMRGIIAQPIMWLYGYQLGFIKATVIQKRNAHDLMKDFISEIPMYQQTEKVYDIVLKSISYNTSIENNLYNSYEALLKENIVCKAELTSLNAWLVDIGKLTNTTIS
jgi:hypothetical protein